MTYDPSFIPFEDKSSTNPRYEALYNILGRVNDKLQTNDDCDSGKRDLKELRVQMKRARMQTQAWFQISIRRMLLSMLTTTQAMMILWTKLSGNA